MADRMLSTTAEDHAQQLLRELGRVVEEDSGTVPFTVEVAVDCYRCVVTRVASEHDLPALSPREREIATMVSSGCTNKGIADALDISTWTVASHLRRIFAKLGVTSRAAMTAQVVVNGVHAGRVPPSATGSAPKVSARSDDEVVLQGPAGARS